MLMLRGHRAALKAKNLPLVTAIQFPRRSHFTERSVGRPHSPSPHPPFASGPAARLLPRRLTTMAEESMAKRMVWVDLEVTCFAARKLFQCQIFRSAWSLESESKVSSSN